MGLKHRWSVESAAARLLESEWRETPLAIAGTLNLALIFPAPYAMGMSNLGFLTVHRLASATPGIGVERFFLPLEAGAPHPPPYYSLETRRPLGDFDILAFSLSCETDFAVLPAILGPLGIPVRAEARAGRRFPLLLAGGAAIGANAAAVSRVFDVLVPGEAETVLPRLLERFLADGPRPVAAADLPGVWTPAFRAVPNPSGAWHPVAEAPAWSHLISSRNVFGGAGLIEVMRGCPRRCPFCLARALYHPPRPVPAARVLDWVDRHSHVTDLGLIAPSLFDHPELRELFAGLLARGRRVHNSSAKWEKLDGEILAALRQLGVRSLTLAPETGSARLRTALEKPLCEESFSATLDRVWGEGFEGVKLYFMLGLPGETEDDIDETVAFLARCAARVPAGRELAASFSGFVPKRLTPWQDRPPPDAALLRQRLQEVRRALRKAAPDLRFRAESPEDIVNQAFFARVGPELAEHLEKEALAWRSGHGRGFRRFDPSDC